MPELPEVEITRRGIAAVIEGRTVTGVVVRNRQLRWPVAPGLQKRLSGLALQRVLRRGKYLLFDFRVGWLILHLGMSGSLRIVDPGAPPVLHEHFDLVFGSVALRLRDPRRFGTVLWTAGKASEHPLLARLGMEPLSGEFSGAWLHAATRKRRTAIKTLLMNATVLAGVGNIYANESLFRAGITPRTPADRLSRARCDALASALAQTLKAAIAAGGSSVRDFVNSDGGSGWFQQEHFVYARDGLPCRVCGTAIRTVRLAQRSTYWCPRCQK